jgi:hypothetical protein
MKFSSEEEAKNYALEKSARYFTLEEATRRINDYEQYLDNACTDSDKEYWTTEIARLKEWIVSDSFINGHYPQGIDDLILELLEWRSSIYAFQHVTTKRNPFSERVFHAQWLAGATYAIFSIIGKLVSKDSRDNSLRALWDNVKTYISESGLCGEREYELIEQQMHESDGHFTNRNSKSLLFRNKAISHNESSPVLEWSEIDKDIELLSRVWSLITMWSSVGIIEPFRSSDAAFSGLDNVYNSTEIEALKEARNQYIELAQNWFVCSLVDGSTTVSRCPIAKIGVSITSK